MGIPESILALLALLIPFGIWLYKRRVSQKEKSEPSERDQEIDHAFASPNPDEHARELQSLDDRLHRAEIDGPPR